jgi:ABC-type methionine transport system permease subunit
MGISLILDVPQSIWFAMSSSDPMSNHLAFDIVSNFHIIAVSGFTFCMGIPICVWAGMVTGNEINIFEPTYTTLSKAVLHISIVLAMVNIVVVTVLNIVGNDPIALDLYISLAMEVSQLLLSLTWLCVGISLQRMVARTSVGSSVNIVFSLNVIILLVFLCNLTRVIVISLLNYRYASASPDWVFTSYQFGCILVPYCFGNFLLIWLMSASLKYEHRIESRLLKSSRTDSVSDVLFLALTPDDEYTGVPVDEN